VNYSAKNFEVRCGEGNGSCDYEKGVIKELKNPKEDKNRNAQMNSIVGDVGDSVSSKDWKLTGDGVFVVEGAGVLVEDPPCVPDGFGPNATYPKRPCD